MYLSNTEDEYDEVLAVWLRDYGYDLTECNIRELDIHGYSALQTNVYVQFIELNLRYNNHGYEMILNPKG